jgi:hypothetical protein
MKAICSTAALQNFLEGLLIPELSRTKQLMPSMPGLQYSSLDPCPHMGAFSAGQLVSSAGSALSPSPRPCCMAGRPPSHHQICSIIPRQSKVPFHCINKQGKEHTTRNVAQGKMQIHHRRQGNHAENGGICPRLSWLSVPLEPSRRVARWPI